jgi:lipid A 3-O-deacylase
MTRSTTDMRRMVRALTSGRRHRPLIWAILAGANILSIPDLSEAQPPGLTSPQTGIVFYTENDDWPPDTGTDKNYTNGFRLTLERNSDIFRLHRLRVFAWVPQYTDCHAAEEDDTCVSTAVHFGQQFYTPDDISVSALLPRDRPYAGWLYVGGSWRAGNQRRVASTDFYVGTTGPASLADPVQTGWHRIVGATTPMGWDNQIGSRLGLIVGHSRHWALDAVAKSHRWFEVSPFLGGNVGNIITDAHVGARVKVGFNITRDWTHSAIGPVVATDANARPGNFEFYVSLDGRGRIVPYNAFIDAAERHLLDRRIGVGDGGIGLGVRLGPIMATYRIARISREYEEAPGAHEYKALRFMWVIR